MLGGLWTLQVRWPSMTLCTTRSGSRECGEDLACANWSAAGTQLLHGATAPRRRNSTSSRGTARPGVRRGEGARWAASSATRPRRSPRRSSAGSWRWPSDYLARASACTTAPCRFDVVAMRCRRPTPRSRSTLYQRCASSAADWSTDSDAQCRSRLDRSARVADRPELRKDPVTGRWVSSRPTAASGRPTSARAARPDRRRALPVLRGPRSDDAARGAGLPPERQRRRTRRAGTCASCRTSFRRCRSKAASTAQGEGLFDR